MTPEQFAYWLNGLAELTDKAPTDKQWTEIKLHLKSVFTQFPRQTVTPTSAPNTLRDAIGQPWRNDSGTPIGVPYTVTC